MKITEVEQLDDIRPIVAGDVLWVRMIQDRGEALKVRVAESGMVLLPHIGLMTAQGLTCRQLARLAQKEMERLYYQSSIVTIAQSPNTTGAAMP